MGRTKGSKNKPKSNPVGKATPARGEEPATKFDDLQYEVAILKAALKQFIREQKEWRLRNEKAVDILTDRVQRHLLAGYDNGGSVYGVRPAGGSDVLQIDGSGLVADKRTGAA